MAALSLRRGATPWSRRRRVGYAFVAPVFLFLCAVVVFPLLHAFWTSLHRVRGLSSTFVGMQNYVRVLTDDAFWHSLAVSLQFTGACVALHMVIGLGLALLLDELRFARTALRIAFLTPWMVAPAIGATIWLWMLEPQFGVVNYLLQAAGIIPSPLAWLGTPALAFASVVTVDVWRGAPFVMLLMLAGLQTIPREQYEAAGIDGANAWQRFRYVTLPNLRYLLIVASTLDVINTIRHYDTIGVMTAGGPAGATEVLPVLLFNTAFRGNRFGDAAAIGVLLMLIVLAFAIFHIHFTRPDQERAR